MFLKLKYDLQLIPFQLLHIEVGYIHIVTHRSWTVTKWWLTFSVHELIAWMLCLWSTISFTIAKADSVAFQYQFKNLTAYLKIHAKSLEFLHTTASTNWVILFQVFEFHFICSKIYFSTCIYYCNHRMKY